MRSVVSWMLVGLVVLGGCHQRFKKNVGSIGDVRPEVLVTTGPSVVLGGSGEEGLIAAAVNVAQAVRSVNVADRLSQAVDIDRVNSAFAESLVQTLGGGPPFGSTNDPSASVLQVEVVNYGLVSPAMGMQGTFNYELRISIFKSDGQKVYSAQHGCAVAFGEASALSQALGTVNNVKQIKDMSDEQIQEAFEGAAHVCGQQLVMKMRQHAG